MVQKNLDIYGKNPCLKKKFLIGADSAGAEGRISNILTQNLSHLAWDWAKILKIDLNLWKNSARWGHGLSSRYQL